jgi:hypothetical protein
MGKWQRKGEFINTSRVFLRLFVGSIVVMLLLGSNIAHAVTAAILEYPESTFAAQGGQDLFTLGWEFRVSSTIDVVALGVTYVYADNKNQVADIGLWNLDGQPLASARVQDGTTQDGSLYIYATIPATRLLYGETYVIGSIFGGPCLAFGDGATPAEYPANVVYAPEIKVLADRSVFGEDLTFPVNRMSVEGNASYVNLGPNFVYEIVPEPGTLALLTLGGLLLRRRR